MMEETTSTLSTTRKLTLPQCPDENTALAHDITTFFEQCERKFIEYGYLNVARRAGLPDGAEEYKYKTMPPSLPATDHHHHRREETRADIALYNERIESKLTKLWLDSWTALYSALLDSTEKTAPGLHRTLLN